MMLAGPMNPELANYEGMDWWKANISAPRVVFLKLTGNMRALDLPPFYCFHKANPPLLTTLGLCNIKEWAIRAKASPALT